MVAHRALARGGDAGGHFAPMQKTNDDDEIDIDHVREILGQNNPFYRLSDMNMGQTHGESPGPKRMRSFQGSEIQSAPESPAHEDSTIVGIGVGELSETSEEIDLSVAPTLLDERSNQLVVDVVVLLDKSWRMHHAGGADAVVAMLHQLPAMIHSMVQRRGGSVVASSCGSTHVAFAAMERDGTQLCSQSGVIFSSLNSASLATHARAARDVYAGEPSDADYCDAARFAAEVLADRVTVNRSLDRARGACRRSAILLVTHGQGNRCDATPEEVRATVEETMASVAPPGSTGVYALSFGPLARSKFFNELVHDAGTSAHVFFPGSRTKVEAALAETLGEILDARAPLDIRVEAACETSDGSVKDVSLLKRSFGLMTPASCAPRVLQLPAPHGLAAGDSVRVSVAVSHVNEAARWLRVTKHGRVHEDVRYYAARLATEARTSFRRKRLGGKRPRLTHEVVRTEIDELE